MTWRSVPLVYAKELRETLRDRRTLVVMVLLPLALYPLVGVGVSQWVAVHETARAERASAVGVGGPAWPDLDRALEGGRHVRLTRGAWGSAAAREQQVRAGVVDAILEVPADYAERQRSDGTVELTLTYDETRDGSELARQRVRSAVRELASELRDARLAVRDLPTSFVEPLRAVDRSVSSAREVGAHLLAGVLPLLIILMVLLGAFYPAIDLTAGERERGTLETLLVTPVERTSLVAGKFLAVATIATSTGILNLASIGLTFLLGFGPVFRAAGLTPSMPWSTVALTLVALVPAALFFAAVMMAVAAVARSFKEAQNLLTPVYMACMLPAMAGQLPGIGLGPITALIPVVNVSLLTRELISAKVAPLPVTLALCSTALYTLIALRIAARIYRSERLLFAAADRGRRARGAARPRRTLPTPGHAAKLLAVVMLLILFVGQPLQARHLVGGLLATEWLLVALPVLLLVRWGSLAPASALGLRRASPAALVGAALTGVSCWYLVGVLVEGLQQRFLPMPKELIEEMRRLLFSGDRRLAVDLVVMALSPAVCEELLFRGVLLRASYPALRLPSALLLNGLLFGLFHLSIYRFFPTVVLGVVLAFIAVRSGSIWPAIVFHLLNNACAVLVGRYAAGLEQSGASGLNPILIGVAAVLFIGGLLLVIGRRSGADDGGARSSARP